MPKSSAASKPAPPNVPAVGPQETERQRKMKRLAVRWGGRAVLLERGFVAVPLYFFELLSSLPKPPTPTETVFILNLMYHKRDRRDPYPAYKTIAKRMAISVSYARDLARNLVRKQLLNLTIRVGLPNLFDLEPLFAKLAELAEKDMEARRLKTKKQMNVA